jgi:hypothetical protein
VVPELDGDVVTAEQVGEPGQLLLCGPGSVVDQGTGNMTLAAPGQDAPVTGGSSVACEGLQVEAGRPLLPCLLRRADGPAQAGVAGGIPGQHQKMGALGIGDATLGPVQVERQLGAEDGGQADGAGRLGEADHAVEPVMVGEGQGGEAETGGFLDQFLRVGGPVEEAEVRVAVQLGVGSGRLLWRRRRGLVGLAFTGPGRAVPTVGGRRGVARPAI